MKEVKSGSIILLHNRSDLTFGWATLCDTDAAK